MGSIKIKPVSHVSLSQIVAGRLAALVLDGTLAAGDKLPSERMLMSQLQVSRSTLREGLSALTQNHLLEVRPGVGYFVRPIDRRNYAQAMELTQAQRASGGLAEPHKPAQDLPAERAPAGPKPLPRPADKPIRIPDPKRDRLATFDLISWWKREKVQAARVMVVGAGALGNEVIKNLSLMGVGHLFLVDFDRVEAANLSRSVLFRERDQDRSKAEVAAAQAKALNPGIRVQYVNGDVATQVGLGVFRRMDVVIGCLDNREARLAVNRLTHWMGKPWVDGAIQELLGLARVFVPGEGACYECTLTEAARREMALRYSCPLLARSNLLLGRVPTTPTIASMIGALQAQEALKLIHGLPVEAGKVIHFNGMTNAMHTTSYLADEHCESHWVYGPVSELPLRAETTSLAELLSVVRGELGPRAVLELDQELVLSLDCHRCGTQDPILRPISEVSEERGRCPTCGLLRAVEMTHRIEGEETFLQRTLSNLGVPKLHILRAHNDQEYRFYELTGDLDEALHFGHHEREPTQASDFSIRLGPETLPPDRRPTHAGSRIRFHD